MTARRRAVVASAAPAFLSATFAFGSQTFSVSVAGDYVAPGSSYSSLLQATYGSSSGWFDFGYDDSYQAYTGTPSQLSAVYLTVNLQVYGVSSPTTFGSRLSFFTGWDPVDYQFSVTESIITNANGAWTKSWQWTGAGVSPWTLPQYGSTGSFYAELFRPTGDFSGQFTAALTFVTVPTPGVWCAVLVGVAASRRRRSR